MRLHHQKKARFGVAEPGLVLQVLIRGRRNTCVHLPLLFRVALCVNAPKSKNRMLLNLE